MTAAKQRAAQLLRQHLWRVPMFLLLIAITSAGLYALRIRHRTIYLGQMNPARNAVLVHTYDDLPNPEMLQIAVRDIRTGALLHDLTDYSWANYRFGWLAERNGLVGQTGDSSRLEIIEIEFTPDPETVRRETVETAEVAFDNPAGTLVHVENRGDWWAPEDGRPFLRIMHENTTEIARLEYGKAEHVSAWPTSDGTAITVVASPDPAAPPRGDFVLTDGTQWSVQWIHATTGEILHTVAGRNTILGTPSHSARTNPTTGITSIARLGQESRPLLNFRPGYRAVFLDEQQVVTFQHRGKKPVTLHHLETKEVKTYDVPRLDYVHPAETGKLFLVTSNGRLQKLHLSNGEIHELLNVRPWFRTCQWVSLLGLPVIGIAWLWCLRHSRSMDPILEWEMAILILTTVFMLWSRSISPGTPLRGFFDSVVYTLLGALGSLFLIWVSTFRSVWGRGLPMGIVGFAALLFVTLMWSEENIVVDLTIAATSFVVWQSLGLGFISWRYGGIFQHSPDLPESNSSQLTLRQIAVAIASCAVLFTSLRVATWERAPMSVVFVIWLCSLTLLYTIVTMLALWSALRFSRPIVSTLYWLAAAVPLMAGHGWVSQQLNLGTMPHSFQWQVQVGLSGLILFTAMRFCRRFGYTLGKSVAASDRRTATS